MMPVLAVDVVNDIVQDAMQEVPVRSPRSASRPGVDTPHICTALELSRSAAVRVPESCASMSPLPSRA